MVNYARPATSWQDSPSTTTPVMAAYLNGVDDILADLGASGGRVASLESYARVLLIDNAAALPAGTPAGVVVVVRS